MRRFYKTLFFLVTIMFLMIQSRCSSSLGSGVIDGIELGSGLWLDLEKIQKVTEYDPSIGELMNTYLDPMPEEMDSLRVYSASTDVGNGVTNIRIILFPLQTGSYDSAYLGITVLESGLIERVRIWGNDFVNQDSEAAIENFYRQFDKKRNLLSSSEMMTIMERDEYISGLDEKKRYLYEHPVLMFGNNFLIRRTMALTGQDIVPKIKWYQERVEVFESLIENVELLDGLMDQQAMGEYRKSAKNSSDGLKKMIQEVDGGASAGKIRDMIKDLRVESCGGCHMIEAVNGTGNTLRDKPLSNLGRKDGIYKVGFDVWAMPDDAFGSNYLNNLIKAGVYYVSYLDQSN